MAEPTLLIPQINMESRNWVVRCRVSESIPAMLCSNGYRLKRYVFSDIEGNEVMASIYGQDVDILSPMINLYGLYDISNADVKLIDKKYKVLSNPFQWYIRRHTFIRSVPEANPNLRYFLDSLIPFSRIPDSYNAGTTTADIMGVVIDADEIKQVNYGQNKVQHFTVVDVEKIPICLSLWDEMINSEGETLVQAARDHSVVVAKRLAIKNFNCISLAVKNSSSLAINPPVQAATDLRSWIQTLQESELQNLKIKKTCVMTRELVSAGRMRTYTVSEIATNAPTGDYWIRGYLMLTDDTQRLYYVACNNCLTKIKAEIGLRYTCFICKNNVEACLRPLVRMTIADQSDILEVIAVEEVAERILQTTTEDMTRLHNTGEKIELDSIKAQFDGKTFLMLLRRTSGKNTDNQRRLLLMSYYDDSTTDIPSGSSRNSN